MLGMFFITNREVLILPMNSPYWSISMICLWWEYKQFFINIFSAYVDFGYYVWQRNSCTVRQSYFDATVLLFIVLFTDCKLKAGKLRGARRMCVHMTCVRWRQHHLRSATPSAELNPIYLTNWLVYLDLSILRWAMWLFSLLCPN
jgi:hypothetical protein